MNKKKNKKLLKDALRYQSQGCSVIPCKPGGKEPLVPWKKNKKKRASKKQIEDWWNEFPDANIGIVTGKVSGIFVVDVDGSRGERFIKKGGFPETVRSETNAGDHYYFRYPDFMVPSCSDKKIKIDIRGEGGYVIAPPSKHPDGPTYTWAVPFDDNTVADPPVWLLEYLQAKAKGRSPKNDPIGNKTTLIKKSSKRWKKIRQELKRHPEIEKWMKTPKRNG